MAYKKLHHLQLLHLATTLIDRFTLESHHSIHPSTRFHPRGFLVLLACVFFHERKLRRRRGESRSELRLDQMPIVYFSILLGFLIQLSWPNRVVHLLGLRFRCWDYPWSRLRRERLLDREALLLLAQTQSNYNSHTTSPKPSQESTLKAPFLNPS